jgi:hypothetical protein
MSDREATHHMTRSTRTVVAAVVAVLTTLATLAVVGVTPASASTVNGVATIANPSTDAFLASGGSNTEFTLTLPPSAHCDGDTATDNYHVWSYLVEEGTSISGLTFSETHEPVPPSSGLGLFDSIPQYYGPENTAITTGQIIGIPTDFEWGVVAADDPSIVPELLYSGGTSGVWEGGLACANGAGTLTDNWNTEITFTKNTGDPNGFVWSAVPGPHGSSFAAITSASSASFIQGTAGSFTPTATGSPTPTITESGTLPAGVTFAGGKLSGTPTASGTFPITFTATNGIGDPAVQDFTLNVGSPPAITSANHVGFVEGTAGTFTVTATGTPAPTLSESGPLPTGVTFVPGTGVLSGTPTATGSFPITFTANNDIGTPATQHFTLTVGTAPTITSVAATTFTKGTAGSFTVTATGFPAPTFTETGTLPAGVTLNGTSGLLSGTPTANGVFPVTLTATNGIGTPATQDFTLTVDAAPQITSADSTKFTEGAVSSFTVTATGTPTPTFAETGALPTGITLTTAGLLSGTPTESGSFPIVITASNAVSPAATQDFTLSVGAGPIFTSADHATFNKGTAGTFTVTASGSPPPTFTETGALPAGVTLNGTSGVLSGTPTQSGSFPIVITAANGSGPNATQNFTLTVDAPAAITSTASTTFVKGHAGSFTVTATGYPLPTLGESGALPAGVTFVPGTGVLSGTPTVTGSFALVFTATNDIGTPATQGFTLTVDALPAITSANATTFTKGDPGTFTVTATGTPAPTLSESGALPTGVTFVPGTGVLSGTPTESGVFHLTFTAANGVLPNATQTFTLTVDAPPAFTSADSATFYTGRANTFTVAASGTPSPTFTATGTLPSGVTLTSAGVLSGTPTATGSFPITLTATNGIGEPASQSFTLTVSLPPLVIGTGSLPGGTVGTAYSQVVDASGGLAPYTWSISGGALPAGLSLSAQTGTISGNPSAAGTADFTVEVTDTDGSTATKALSITIAASVHAPTTLTQPVVGIAAAPGGTGYWLTDAAGDVAPLGSVRTYGSLAGVTLRAPIVQIVATADGGGYWLVGADGGVFAFGDAVFHGSTGNLDLNAPIVGMARTSNDGGYWLVGADGGVFSFGDAAFHGSMGGIPLNKPVVGIATDSATGGYWLAAADGGIFSFDAPFHGSVATLTLNKPIVGVAATPGGGGYWLVGADGGVFNAGDARFHGSAGSIRLNAPVTGVAADSATGGYWLVAADGGIFSYGAPFFGVG